MKRKITLFLILSLLITSLAACKDPNKNSEINNGSNDEVIEDDEGKKDNNKDEKITITVQVEKEWREYYEKAADRVKDRYPNANIEFIEKSTVEHIELLDNINPEDEKVADLFTLPLERLYDMEKKYVLGQLDAKSIAENLNISDHYDKGLGAQFKVDDRYMAFPMNIKTLLNFVNTKNAQANDIDTVKDIEFTELSNEDILIPLFDIWYGISFMNATNIELLTKVEPYEFYSDMTRYFSELSVDEEETFRAIFNYWYYSQKEDSKLFSKDEYMDFMDTSFKTGGNTSLRPGSIKSKKHLSKLAEGEINILPIEKLVVMGNPLLQWKDGDGLAINTRIKDDNDKKEITKAMIEEIVNRDYALEFFKETGKILENMDLETYINSDLNERDKKLIKVSYKSYEDAEKRPASKEWEKVSATWEKAILSWNTLNPQTVEEAYEILQYEFKDMINSIK